MSSSKNKFHFAGHPHTVVGFILAAILGLLYLQIQPGSWVPSSDGDLFLSIARSLATGDGYTSNGLPVAKLPPLWPICLSWLLHFSPSFAAVSLLQSMLLSMAAYLFYRVLLRLVAPTPAVLAVLFTGLNFHWFRLSRMAYSDPLFLVLFAAALLLCLQLAERPCSMWRLFLVLLLTGCSVATRTVGMLTAILLASALLTGGTPQTRKKRAGCAMLVMATAGASFLGLRMWLRRYSEALLARVEQQMISDLGPIDTTLTETRSILSSDQNYLWYLAQAGRWIAQLLVQPLEFLNLFLVGRVAVGLAGWAILLLLGFYVVRKMSKSTRWLWIAAGLFVGLLAARWVRPNVRYLLPILPLLFAGLIETPFHRSTSCGGLRATWRSVPLTCLLFGTVLAANLGLYAAEVWVARSPVFLDRYLGGQYSALQDVALYLNEQDVAPYSICISPYYDNMGRQRINSSGYRSFLALSNHRIRMAPEAVWDRSNPEPFLAWAHTRNIRFFVDRPPVQPWRLYHFRVPLVQQWLIGSEPEATVADFELYEVDGMTLRPISVPKQPEPIRVLPGL